jgi:hypothetical protein
MNQYPWKGVKMRNINFLRLVAVLCIGLMLPLGSGTVLAQENAKDVEIAGRIYDFDQDEPLSGVTVRIVSSETGQARETETDKNGCYEFEDVADDTYTFSVFYKGGDAAMAEKVRGEFILPNKLSVIASTEKDILIKTCASLAEKNSLLLKDDCDLCGGVPPLIWVVPAGLVIAGAVIGGDDDEEASPSRP